MGENLDNKETFTFWFESNLHGNKQLKTTCLSWGYIINTHPSLLIDHIYLSLGINEK